MFKRILQTNDDAALLVLRIMLGVVFFPHGMQKLFGWFGGYGYSGTMDFFTTQLGISALLAFLAIMAESLGSVGLITGFLTRISAFGIMINMVVAVFLLHLQHGFFMNWYGNQKGEGYEFHLLVIAISLVLVIRGGGKSSADRFLAGK
jgi:putative oxidoreductase